MGKARGMRSGAWLFLKRGEMPEGCEEIRRGVSKLHADLADEFAGPGVPLTASQMVLIDRACQLTAFLKLTERAVWKKGPIGADEAGSPEVVPALSKFYIAATNGVAKALRTLSEVSSRIESTGKQAPNVKEYLLAKTEKPPAARRVQRFSDDEPADAPATGGSDFPLAASATDSTATE
jgi:hypothetical protein